MATCELVCCLISTRSALLGMRDRSRQHRVLWSFIDYCYSRICYLYVFSCYLHFALQKISYSENLSILRPASLASSLYDRDIRCQYVLCFSPGGGVAFEPTLHLHTLPKLIRSCLAISLNQSIKSRNYLCSQLSFP